MHDSRSLALDYNALSDHRFTPPGRRRLYGNVGPEPFAIEIIQAELQALSADQVIVDARKYQLSSVLNLSDETVTKVLGVSKKEIMSYELTQQIGSLAKSRGYDAVIFSEVHP